jgi:hypothetical protein
VNRLRAAFRGRSGAVLSVSLIVWALALFDLTLLPRMPIQYLITLPSKQLVDVRVEPGSVVMTSTDPGAPGDLWILSRGDTGIRVVGAPLPLAHGRRGARDRTLAASVRMTLGSPDGTPIDVDNWADIEPALFVISSPRRSPSLQTLSLRTGRRLLESRVPVPPQLSDRRDFFVARWSGPRPDLFVIDRDANRLRSPSFRPWSIRIYTGESGFETLAFETSIRKRLSKRLSQGNWWLDVGTRRKPKPSLVLMTKGRQTGTGQTEVHVLSGRSRFRRFTLQTGTELPEGTGSTHRFVFQSERRGGAVLMVQVLHRRLRVVPVPLP